ncbi:hypothetical protein OKZ62_001773 [Vibrio navarrensis]|nr:hypothetical protein [Vibrio navarrensis]
MQEKIEVTVSDIGIFITAFLSGGFGFGLSIGLAAAIYFSVAPDNFIGWIAVLAILCGSIIAFSIGVYWVCRLLKLSWK